MDAIIVPFFQLLLAVLKIYEFIVIASVVMSWLFHFNVINYSNQFVRLIWDMVSKLTEPILSKLRSFIPNLGGLDLSPLILLLGIFFLQNVVVQLMHKF